MVSGQRDVKVELKLRVADSVTGGVPSCRRVMQAWIMMPSTSRASLQASEVKSAAWHGARSEALLFWHSDAAVEPSQGVGLRLGAGTGTMLFRFLNEFVDALTATFDPLMDDQM